MSKIPSLAAHDRPTERHGNPDLKVGKEDDIYGLDFVWSNQMTDLG